jgi:hypothetical protein
MLNFFFVKNRKNQTNLLKAPSRHKKFFHQISYEFYTIKINFNFNLIYVDYKNILVLFNILNTVFLKIGSNTMTRTKLMISFKSAIPTNKELF